MDIYYVITKNCNLHCSFCIRRNLTLKNTDFVSIDNFISSCEILTKAYPGSSLVLTGGEPFTHPDFFRMLMFSMDKFKRVIINSNGTFNNNCLDKLEPYLVKNVYLQVSIDGPQYIHDRYRGKGVYSKCLENIKLLAKYSNHITISTTVLKDNIVYINELAKLLNTMSFHHWKVSPEQVVDCDSSKLIPYEEWNQFVDRLLPLCKFRVHIKKLFYFDLWDKYQDVLSKNNIDAIHSNCGLGRDKLYVTPEGNVQLCTCFQNVIGNLFKEPIDSIIERIVIRSRIEISEKSPCYTCRYKLLCNGGCPGYSNKYFGAMNMGDPRCPIIQSKYEKH